MTIKEVQELIANVDAKEDAEARPAGTDDDIFAYFLDAVRRANVSHTDLTEALVKWLHRTGWRSPNDETTSRRSVGS